VRWRWQHPGCSPAAAVERGARCRRTCGWDGHRPRRRQQRLGQVRQGPAAAKRAALLLLLPPVVPAPLRHLCRLRLHARRCLRWQQQAGLCSVCSRGGRHSSCRRRQELCADRCGRLLLLLLLLLLLALLSAALACAREACLQAPEEVPVAQEHKACWQAYPHGVIVICSCSCSCSCCCCCCCCWPSRPC
jgi:hypothetical protein